LAWSYDPTNLVTTTSTGRLNSVRLLIGDTDTNDQILQNEELYFSLSQTNDNVYYAGAWACRIIAAKFSRLVDTTLDSAGSSRYSHRIDHFTLLANQLSDLGKKTYGKSLGISIGGVSKADMDAVNADPDRVKPAFAINQFDNRRAETYLPGYMSGL